MTISGEFSNGYNDCGLFLQGVHGQSKNKDCATLWTDASTWNDTIKAGVQAFAEASMDAMGNYFFWTWKIGNSTAGHVETPLWSYQLGLENGWMPTDPRTAVGKCARLGKVETLWDGEFEPWQTGGEGAGSIAPSLTSEFPWPPPTISGVDAPGSLLPTYTLTGTVATLTPAPISASGVDAGNGWFNTADTTSAPATIAGCSYAPGWDASGAAAPTAAC
jgi:glucan 1,3-beta-glucosidase